MTPICDQSFKINRTEVNRVIEEVNDSVSMFTVQNPNTQTFFYGLVLIDHNFGDFCLHWCEPGS